MRGLGRIRRIWRRLRGKIVRPPAVEAPAESLRSGLIPAALTDGNPDPGALKRLFRPVHDRDTLSTIAAHPGADLGLTDLAAGILAGRQPLFDGIREQELVPDWLSLPGNPPWPLILSSDYDHADFTSRGDIRQLWEPARLQAAPTLCAAARLGTDGATRAAMGLLEHFRRHNPSGWGPHWIAGLEAGLRIFSLLWTWQLHPDPTDDDILLLTASLRENALFVDGHLSEKEIANNHLIGEVAALYAVGTALPVFPESERWRRRGLEILEREHPLQVLPDGVLGEQAIEYHRFVLEFYLQAWLWGIAGGQILPDHWVERIAAMFRPLAALTGPTGEVIPLGDDDCGRIVRLDNRSRRDCRGVLALGAGYFGVGDLGPLATEPTGEPLWLLGCDPDPVRFPADGDLPRQESFPDAGWHTLRFGCPKRGDGITEGQTLFRGGGGLPEGHLLFKTGPMGRGGAGHSHLDQLSLTLSLGGREILVDPGTGLYNGPQMWRDYFRGGSAHNTLRLGGRDAALTLPAPDRFGWERKCEAHLIRQAIPGGFPGWEGVRRGDLSPVGVPLEPRRQVALLGEGVILVVDSVTGLPEGSPSLPLEQFWHCAPDLRARWSTEAAEIEGICRVPGFASHHLELSDSGGAVLRGLFLAPEGLRPGLVEGESTPPGGWYSANYGSVDPAPCPFLSGEIDGPILLITLLIDPRAGHRPERCTLERAGGNYCLEIQGPVDEKLKIDLDGQGDFGRIIPIT